MRSLMPVLHVLSLVVLIFGLTMLVPVSVSWLLHDGAESAFDEAIALTLATGALLAFATRKSKRDLRIRDGFLMVALVWTVLPVFAALPLVIGLLLAVPLGWLARRFPVLRTPIIAGTGLLYTIPSLALFILMPLVIGTGILDPINVIVARPEIVAATAALASAHALASLAYTQLNPPPRRFRPRPAGWTNTTRPQAGER